jgi:hypothetical protein
MPKVCHKCEVLKEDSKFSKDKSRKDGLSDRCKDCVRKYTQENRGKIATQRKEYYLENKDKVTLRRREYYQKEKEMICEKRKAFRRDNK